MKWIRTEDGVQHIEDNNHKVTAQKYPNDTWRRTFPANEYSQAPTRSQSLSTRVVEEVDITPGRLPIASRPIFNGEFEQVDGVIMEHGLLPVIRSLTLDEGARVARYFINKGDLVSALVVREEIVRFVFGSHTFTTNPEAEMSCFDAVTRQE